MVYKRFLTCLSLVMLCLLVPRPVAATAIANSSLNFTNLAIVPTVGSLTLNDVWSQQAFASANNSLGESDAHFNFAFSPATTGAPAAVTWATATGAAAALGDPPDLNVSGSVTSSANIPGCNAAAAFSTGLGTLSNSFTISGVGAVSVQFGADIGGTLNVFTDSCGPNAFTETIFTLAVDGGDPILFDQRMLSIGPDSSHTQSFSTHLSNSLLLDAGVSHFLILQADSESQAQVPEPASSALLLVGLGALLWGRLRSPYGAKMRREALARALRRGN